jgi:hypothetical protein
MIFRFLLLSLAFEFAALSGLVRAGELQSQQPPPTIRIDTSLVLVDVITQDPKTFLPVRDLSKDDFLLFDNGKPVEILSMDSGAAFGNRPVALWLVVQCNMRRNKGGSRLYVGREQLFRPALDHLDKADSVGVAHWCDDGHAEIDLPPTEDRDAPLRALAKVIAPMSFTSGPEYSGEGEIQFRRLIRLIIKNSFAANPRPLPVIVFLDGDYTGQPPDQLNLVIDDFLETAGVVFGIRDLDYPRVPDLWSEQKEIMHYMADATGGQFLEVTADKYALALDQIIVQLHFRYSLAFKPAALDGKRHKLQVKLSDAAKARHPDVRLRWRPDYRPTLKSPAWLGQ